jgi:DnaK suppressor protein
VDISVARKRLEEMRDDLDRSISVLQGEHPEARPEDAADAGANLSEADRNEAVLHSARSQRTAVMAALARVENGDYGNCVDCGKPVPEGRLEARPEAGRCVGCQAKWDRRRH